MKDPIYFKRSLALVLRSAMIVVAVLITASCSLNPGVEEIRATKVPSAGESPSLAGGGGPGVSFPISFHRVDLFVDGSASTTGTITVQIRNADGSVVIGSTTVPASSLNLTAWARNTFLFSPALTLNSGEKYRIYVTRSNPHNGSDHLTWRFNTANAYAPGGCSVNPGWAGDFGFATYSNGYLDQRNLTVNYGFGLSPTYFRWQEFVPQYIWVIG